MKPTGVPAVDYPVISFILEVTGMKIETLSATVGVALSLAFALAFVFVVFRYGEEE